MFHRRYCDTDDSSPPLHPPQSGSSARQHAAHSRCTNPSAHRCCNRSTRTPNPCPPGSNSAPSRQTNAENQSPTSPSHPQTAAAAQHSLQQSPPVLPPRAPHSTSHLHTNVASSKLNSSRPHRLQRITH